MNDAPWQLLSEAAAIVTTLDVVSYVVSPFAATDRVSPLTSIALVETRAFEVVQLALPDTVVGADCRASWIRLTLTAYGFGLWIVMASGAVADPLGYSRVADGVAVPAVTPSAVPALADAVPTPFDCHAAKAMPTPSVATSPVVTTAPRVAQREAVRRAARGREMLSVMVVS